MVSIACASSSPEIWILILLSNEACRSSRDIIFLPFAFALELEIPISDLNFEDVFASTEADLACRPRRLVMGTDLLSMGIIGHRFFRL